LLAPPRAHEHPRAAQAFALEHELDLALRVSLAQRLDGIGRRRIVGRIRAPIPEHDGAAAVLALRDGSLEGVVVDGVIFHFHREALYRRIDARPFWHGPTPS